MSARFSRPVIVRLPGAKGGARTVAITNPRDAIAAMTRDGLGGYDVKNSAWTGAFHLLTQAALAPTRENMDAAQEALEALAASHAARH